MDAKQPQPNSTWQQGKIRNIKMTKPKTNINSKTFLNSRLTWPATGQYCKKTNAIQNHHTESYRLNQTWFPKIYWSKVTNQLLKKKTSLKEHFYLSHFKHNNFPILTAYRFLPFPHTYLPRHQFRVLTDHKLLVRIQQKLLTRAPLDNNEWYSN